jgi:hypothetical protein
MDKYGEWERQGKRANNNKQKGKRRSARREA